MDITVQTLEELGRAAKTILDFAGERRIFLLFAPMGAGKTTLIKEMCKVLGATDSLSSPTYSIVNEYSYPEGKIYHFDLYRLKDQEELLDLGIEEYLDSGHYCFFEWPELVLNFIDKSCVKVEVSHMGNIRYIRAAHE
jgi:tRNA threonylcarbamoyladenosine biosynthesis protein TsaE